ncbi:glycerol-3-phosphate dehydrogenase [Falsiroseomonas selenitidurans]|uniref:Glycerol-3-phosphate dehydrogenase n=1 Tax=Falsiroseomonas selenitidurans TaxID=2716335 RepID=A0ABX1DWQ0_9PROT|nr:glycerol-3-phosphate dehydrogenase [Falsiroseomonas selenitidurans]NKC29330.1 glycerol-3-phosphate dehydrogenase [Falsiroseomonas selenitidurans]
MGGAVEMTADCDLLVIGGGINGVGIARDAAGRGLSVCLVERGDLAGGTSSNSSKLVHGGLRYLEHYAFRLVREALAEREVLLRIAPHIVWPMRFVLPHRPAMRPRWMIRAGLFLYDHLARRVSLKAAEGLDFRQHPYGAPLAPALTAGFAYSDCWVEDSRLVVLNARDAARRGAAIRTRTAFVGAARDGEGWTVRLRGADGSEETLRCRALANAAGPWVMAAQDATHARRAGSVRLIRGSHIVLPALYAGDQAYILQHDDRRVVFVIPYQGRFSLVGTTDVPHEGDAATAHCTPAEAEYLCAAVSRQFRRAVTPAGIVWSYAGVRPLYDDGSDDPSAITRDYVLKLDAAGAPLLSIYGGKITTYRRLAEEAVDRIAGTLGRSAPAWTASAALPGGAFGGLDLPGFEAAMQARFPWMPAPLCARLVRAYGSDLPALLGDAASLADLGRDHGAGLTQREVDWLVREEWAMTADDILWRRSRLGLHMTAAEREAFAAAMGAG